MFKFWIVLVYKADVTAMNGNYPTFYGYMPDDAVYTGQGGVVFINEIDARRAYDKTLISDEVTNVVLIQINEDKRPTYIARK